MRKFALLGALTLVFACGSFHLRGPAYATRAPEHLDLLLAGGQVVDGSGSPARAQDVGIRGDRIAFLGNATKEKVTAERTLDVHGLMVCPGFIDPHTHTIGDLSSPKRNGNVTYLMQGVTTVVGGNDGERSPFGGSWGGARRGSGQRGRPAHARTTREHESARAPRHARRSLRLVHGPVLCSREFCKDGGGY